MSVPFRYIPPAPTKVITPIAKCESVKVFERVEDFAAVRNVAVIWALGCDAAIIFGPEADVVDVIKFAVELDPAMFRGEPLEE